MSEAEGVFVHDPDKCEGEHCCFHNPSQHALSTAPWHIRFDKPVYRLENPWTTMTRVLTDYLTERTCEHGVGHPDPDALAYLAREYPPRVVEAMGVHGCDGCC